MQRETHILQTHRALYAGTDPLSTVLVASFWTGFWLNTTHSTSAGQALLNLTWRPQLAITGAEGLPTLVQAGNVLRPYTAVKVSMRVPPAVDAPTASAALKVILEADPPHNADVSYTEEKKGSGWDVRLSSFLSFSL